MIREDGRESAVIFKVRKRKMRKKLGVFSAFLIKPWTYVEYHI